MGEHLLGCVPNAQTIGYRLSTGGTRRPKPKLPLTPHKLHKSLIESRKSSLTTNRSGGGTGRPWRGQPRSTTCTTRARRTSTASCRSVRRGAEDGLGRSRATQGCRNYSILKVLWLWLVGGRKTELADRIPHIAPPLCCVMRKVEVSYVL